MDPTLFQPAPSAADQTTVSAPTGGESQQPIANAPLFVPIGSESTQPVQQESAPAPVAAQPEPATSPSPAPSNEPDYKRLYEETAPRLQQNEQTLQQIRQYAEQLQVQQAEESAKQQAQGRIDEAYRLA